MLIINYCISETGLSEKNFFFFETHFRRIFLRQERRIKMALDLDTMKVKDIMTKSVISIPESASIKKMIETIRSEGISGLPVTDKNGKAVGIVSATDVVQYACSAAPGNIVLKKKDHSDYYTYGESLQVEYLDGEIAESTKQTTVGDIMTPHLHSVQENDSVSEVATLMIERAIHRVTVVRDGAPIGIVTTMDLIKLMKK
jgi:CBS domain-containing protein